MKNAAAHTDFAKAFRLGHVFQTKDRKVRVLQKEIAKLVVPSGKLTACDPGYLSFGDIGKPFRRKLPPGTFPVIISFGVFGKFQMPTCAMLQTKKTRPVRWEMATRPGEDVRKLGPLNRFGFGVDSGMGCFCDLTVAGKLGREEFEDRVTRRIESGMGRRPIRTWWNVEIDQKSGANLVAFQSGLGDGCYPCYWGFDRAGEICCLVADFEVFIEPIKAEVVVENILKKLTKRLVAPDLDAAGLTVRVQHQSAHTLQVTVAGGHCDFELMNSGDLARQGAQRGNDPYQTEIVSRHPLTADARLLLKFVKGYRAP